MSLEKIWKSSLNSSVVHSFMFAYVILCVSSFHVFNPSQNFDHRSHLSNIMIIFTINQIITTTTNLAIFDSFESNFQAQYSGTSRLQLFTAIRRFTSVFSTYLSATMMRISALFITGAAALSVGRTDEPIG